MCYETELFATSDPKSVNCVSQQTSKLIVFFLVVVEQYIHVLQLVIFMSHDCHMIHWMQASTVQWLLRAHTETAILVGTQARSLLRCNELVEQLGCNSLWSKA